MLVAPRRWLGRRGHRQNAGRHARRRLSSIFAWLLPEREFLQTFVVVGVGVVVVVRAVACLGQVGVVHEVMADMRPGVLYSPASMASLHVIS